jgi:hypothetical protein
MTATATPLPFNQNGHAPTARTRRDIEASIGIDPIEVLQADRRRLLDDEQYASIEDAIADDCDPKWLLSYSTPDESGGQRVRYLRPGLAKLRARFGHGGTWDARRKAFRSAIANELAMEALQTSVKKSKIEKGEVKTYEIPGEKPAEAELERLAAGDPRVQASIDEAEELSALYWRLELQFDELTELINRDQALVRYVTSEPKT